MLKKEHPIYLETTAFRSIVQFTMLQLVLLGVVYGITWAGIVGVIFPGTHSTCVHVQFSIRAACHEGSAMHCCERVRQSIPYMCMRRVHQTLAYLWGGGRG